MARQRNGATHPHGSDNGVQGEGDDKSVLPYKRGLEGVVAKKGKDISQMAHDAESAMNEPEHEEFEAAEETGKSKVRH